MDNVTAWISEGLPLRFPEQAKVREQYQEVCLRAFSSRQQDDAAARLLAKLTFLFERHIHRLLRPLTLMEENGGLKLDPSFVDRQLDTLDGPGYLTCHLRKQDVAIVAPEQKKRLYNKVGVVLLDDWVACFYLPGTIWQVLEREIRFCHSDE